MSCRPTGTWTARRAGSGSTSGCSSWPRTRASPLLERVRFLAIFASNLDEFFMVRVAGRIRRMATGLPVEQRQRAVAGADPGEHAGHGRRADPPARRRCFSDSVLPALAREGIEILRWKELEQAEQEALQQLFRERIYPVLTPLVVDPAHPFPYISGLSLSLAVMIADPQTGTTMFARVKVPPLLPRFLTVAPNRFVPLEDVIAAHLPELFAGLDVLEHHAFRVTRIRDLEIDEDVTEDLLKSLERELTRRRFEQAVRLEVEESMSSDVLDKLVTELGVDTRAVYRLPGPLDLSGLYAIADLDLPQLKYPPFVPSETALPTRHEHLHRDRRARRARAPPVRLVRGQHPAPGGLRRGRSRGCWRSSRPCTGPAATPRSWTR